MKQPSMATESSSSDLRRISNLLLDVQEELASIAIPFTTKQNHELGKALTAMHQLLLTYRGGSPHDAPATEAEGK